MRQWSHAWRLSAGGLLSRCSSRYVFVCQLPSGSCIVCHFVLLPFDRNRMSLSCPARSAHARRNVGKSLVRSNCKEIDPSFAFAHARFFSNAVNHSFQSPVHISPSPSRLCRTAAAPVTPPTTDATLLYVRIGISLLCVCASVVCISVVFLVRRLLTTVKKLNDTIDIVNQELPGVAASVRLTSLEMADCILEFAGLGRDVSGGIRAGGRALKATEASLQESGDALKSVWANYVKPGINERIQASKEIWDHTLHANADLDREPTPGEVAAVTRMSIAELRQSLAAITALHQVVVQGVRVVSSVQQASTQTSVVDDVDLQSGIPHNDAEAGTCPAAGSENPIPESGPSHSAQSAGAVLNQDNNRATREQPGKRASAGESGHDHSSKGDHIPRHEEPG